MVILNLESLYIIDMTRGEDFLRMYIITLEPRL